MAEVLTTLTKTLRQPAFRIDLPFYEDLLELFTLVESNKLNELGLGDGETNQEGQKKLIEMLINRLFCQHTYTTFSQSEIAKVEASILIQQKSKFQKENINIQNIRKGKGKDKNNQNSNSNLKLNLDNDPALGYSDDPAKKTLFDLCYDIGVFLLIRMSENEDGDINYDIASTTLMVFVGHIRLHFQRGKNNHCMTSALALYKVLFFSKNLSSIAKEKDIISKLMIMLPSLFKEEAQSMTSSIVRPAPQEINLNQLILGQGLQNQQQFYSQFNQAQNSSKSSFQEQHNNVKSPITTEQIPREEIKKQTTRIETLKKKLSFNRAASEPPSSNKNAVMPVKEDMNDENSIEYEKGGEIIDSDPRLGEPHIYDQNYKTSQNGKSVPPLLIGQINSQQYQTPSLNQQHSSSVVMSNYFNMPLGQFNTTINMNQNQQVKGVPPGALKMNFYPQNTLAKSRLTRRQMSMSRRLPHKLQSATNLMITQPDDKESRKVYESFQNEQSQDQKSVSVSVLKKGFQVPKLNINSIIYDNNIGGQRIDSQAIPTSSQNPIQTNNKSSNRSNRAGQSQTRAQGNNLLANYQTNANYIRQENNGGESAHNISIYDEVNGSFIDDGAMQMGDGQAGLIYDNALEKLRQIAIQLGESCLTNDLAALISQKRDRELVESARKIANIKESDFNQASRQRSLKLKPKTVHRSISVTYTLETNLQINQEPILLIKNSNKDHIRHERLDTEQNASNFMNKRMRLVLLNLIYILLKKYDLEEARFLRSPIPILMVYISSSQFRQKRVFKQIRKLEQGATFSHNLQFTKSKVPGHKAQNIGSDESESESNEYNVELTYAGMIKKERIHPALLSTTNQQKLQQLASVRIKNFAEQSQNIYNYSDNEEGKVNGVDKIHSTNQSNMSTTQFNNDDSPLHQIMRQKSSKSVDQKLKLFLNQELFKVLLIVEEKVIFKLFRKFSFVNEEMIRRQVMNDLSSFAVKDKGIDFKFYNTLTSAKFNPNGSFLNGQGIGSLVAPPLPAPLSGTPIRQFNNMSFDDENEEFYFKKEKLGDGIQQIQNPNCFWSNSGIAYELNNSTSSKSTSSTISKEKIRKKIDTLLYTVDRRLKYALQQAYDKTSTEFAESLYNEIVTLSSYLKEQRSRITLYQVIEVNLETLLMVKKILIEIALKTNIFVMDFSKVAQPDLLASARGKRSKSPKYSGAHQNIGQLIEGQKMHRELFSEYLRLISILLKMPQSQDTLKLLNEVLIFDELWQESVKTYVISLFLQDLVGSLIINEKNQFHNKIIDELNGINLLNFEEATFLSSIMVSQDINLYSQAKDAIFHSLLCAINVMRYYTAITIFFQGIIKLYFSHQETTSKGKSQSENPSNPSENQERKMNANSKGLEGRTEKKAPLNEAGSSDAQSQKYWKHVIRRILYQFMFLITPPNGLLSQYLQTNAINYINIVQVQGSDSIMPTPINKNFLVQNESDVNAPCPINFQLTKYVLNFTKSLFEIPDKFTKYVFIEELMLFYIRTHYISFVRLYNKNYSKKNAPQVSKEASLTLCKKHLECLFAIAKNRNEDTRRKLYQFKVLQFLCQEIQLEYEISQRRMKFIQLSNEEKEKSKQRHQEEEQKEVKSGFKNEEVIKQIQNMIQLDQSNRHKNDEANEQEYKAEKIKIRVSNPVLDELGFGKQKSSQNNLDIKNLVGQLDDPQRKYLKETYGIESQNNDSSPNNQISSISRLKLGVLGNSTLRPENDQQDVGQQVVSQHKISIPSLKKDDEIIWSHQVEEQKQEQIKKQPFKVPALKITGLTLSTITQDDKDTQQQQQQQQVSPIVQVQDQQVKKKFVPPLNVKGLGITGLTQDPPQQQQTNSEQIQPQSQPAPQPFKVPALKIGGLGLTGLNQDNESRQQPQVEQQNVQQPQEQQVKPKIPALKIGGLGLSTLKKDDEVILSHQVEEKKQEHIQKQPFKVPALKIAGLTLSTITQDKEPQQPPAIQQQESVQQPSKPALKIPSLNTQGLGLSTLTKDNDQKDHQPVQTSSLLEVPQMNSHINQTIDYNQEELFQKQNPFENTAPIPNLSQDQNLSDLAQIKKQNQNQNILIQSDVQLHESAQFLLNKTKVECIPDDQLDPKKIAKLNQQRKNLMPPRARNLSTTSKQSQFDNEDDNVQFFEKKHRNDEVTPVKHRKTNEEQKYPNTNQISNFRGSLQSIATPNTQLRLESIIDQQSYMHSPLNEGINNNNLSVQNPSSFCQTPTNLNQSNRSNGSFVGSNKVYIPHLNIPADIHEDPRSKIKIYQKPDDNKFKLTKSNYQPTDDRCDASRGSVQISVGSTSKGGKSGMGKKGRMLDLIGITNEESKEDNNSSVIVQQVSSGSNKIHFNFQQSPETRSVSEKKNGSQRPRLFNQEHQSEIEVQNLDNNPPPPPPVASEKVQNINKKPTIPSLKIPEKGEQPEGKEKIKQQIEVSEQLNASVVAGNLTKLEISLNNVNTKFQLLLDHKNKEQFPQNVSLNVASNNHMLDQDVLMSEAMFYLKERGARPIYQDDELHVLMLSLIMCLLLKPQRGTLEDYYCSQYPIDNGKQNILYLLHFHLNNQENLEIIPNLLKQVTMITPPLAGQRLMKLLCSSLFDLSMYNNGKDWKKIGEGAYAKVYECQMNLSEPQTVAIKQMILPSSIYDRCVLHDIFTEITCLEEFRLEPCVTDLYDYGVDGYSYYIVMKKYAFSLTEWRAKQQQKPFMENLSLYLSIYKEVLKAFAIIHSHNVTHYDIKCDNVLIDMGNSMQNNSLSKWAAQDEERLKITIGDFGECKMFLNEKDEFCARNRGTDYIKSPEMLELAVNTRKDTDKYDRRKQVGTNRLSDIWSLGCLLFELLTGEYLFHEQDYIAFFMRVTRPNEQLLTNEKLEKIGNNIYLIDFLKYMLVRDQKLRPPIESILKRFEHVHALLVSTSSANSRFNLNSQNMYSLRGQTSLESLLEQASQIMAQNSQVFGGEIKEENVQQFDQEQVMNNSEVLGKGGIDKMMERGLDVQLDLQSSKQQHQPSMMRIMADIYLASNHWIMRNMNSAIRLGITHLVIEGKYLTQSLKDKFDILEIPEYSDYLQHHNQELKMNPFLLMPLVLDYLRKVALQKGKIVFIEGHNEISNGQQLHAGIKFQQIRECMLLCLNQVFQTSSYETYTLIKSQNLFFNISSERLATISKWTLISSKIKQYINTFPKFQCICGSCVIILKRQFANYSNIQTINCNCCQFYKNIETSQCPSPGCNEFIQYMKQFFKVQMDSLQWGFLEEEDFFVGPNYIGALAQNGIQHRQIISNMSQTIDKNSHVVSIIEKKSGNQGKDVIGQDYNLISKSSATAKNYHYMGYARWKLFKCKECHVWTHAMNETDNRYALLLNNRIKDNKQANIGILNAKQGAAFAGVRVPILDKIKLKIPF